MPNETHFEEEDEVFFEQQIEVPANVIAAIQAAPQGEAALSFNLKWADGKLTIQFAVAMPFDSFIQPIPDVEINPN